MPVIVYIVNNCWQYLYSNAEFLEGATDKGLPQKFTIFWPPPPVSAYFGLLQAKINSSFRIWQTPPPFVADVLYGCSLTILYMIWFWCLNFDFFNHIFLGKILERGGGWWKVTSSRGVGERWRREGRGLKIRILDNVIFEQHHSEA